MARYQIEMGGRGEDGESWGTWEGETAEAALLSCAADMDHTRRWQTERLSDSPSYGLPAERTDSWGNGAQDRSGWWYLTREDGSFAGVYRLVEDR